MLDRLMRITLSVILLALYSCDFKNEAIAQILPQEKEWYLKVNKIPTPDGYVRENYDTTSFGYFLENLPLKTSDNEVYLYDGTLKFNQLAQFAVLKMDVGNQDLQQCADAVMRLRGEFLYRQKEYDKIHFCFLSDGKPRYFKDYADNNYSYKKFRSYMNYIFSYANTASLLKELKKVPSIHEMKIGDVFIQSGNPYGHAVIIMDVAKNKSGEKVFMIAQSYMPAQEIHLLKNPKNKAISPWYNINFKDELITPEWRFTKSDLYRFP